MFEIYREVEGDWRARFVENGRIIWETSEGYKRRRGVERAITIAKQKMADARVVALETPAQRLLNDVIREPTVD